MAAQHQLAVHHAALFTTGQYLDGLFHIVAAKQQAAQDGTHGLVVVALFRPLADPVGQVRVFGEIFRRVLRHVADVGVFRPLHAALVWLQAGDVARDAAQHGGLAGAVGADDGDAFARLDHDGKVLEQLAVKAFRDVLDFHGQAVQFLFAVETHERIGARRWLDVVDLDLFDLLGARRGLAGLGFVGGEAAHEFLQLGNLVFRFRVVGQLLVARLGRGEHVFVVVARINLQGAVIHVGHVGADLVQEVAIMGNDDHGGVALVEHVFQPANRVDVQVIRRLVEQQDVRVREQRLRQQHAQLPAWRDIAHRALMQVNGDTGAQQQFARARFGRVAVVFGNLAFQLGRLHVVVVRRFRVRVNRVALLDGGPHFRVAHHDDVEDAHVFKRKLVLAQLAQALVGIEHDVAARRVQVAAQDLHERRLAAAVRADQAIAVAVAEFDGDILKQWLGAKLHRNICG